MPDEIEVDLSNAACCPLRGISTCQYPLEGRELKWCPELGKKEAPLDCPFRQGRSVAVKGKE